jgi:uncharacterized protein
MDKAGLRQNEGRDHATRSPLWGQQVRTPRQYHFPPASSYPVLHVMGWVGRRARVSAISWLRLRWLAQRLGPIVGERTGGAGHPMLACGDGRVRSMSFVVEAVHQDQGREDNRAMEHPDAVAYHRTADAFREGDMETLAGLFDEDVIWHIPGTSPLAGEIHGRDALWRWFDRLREVTNGTFTLEDHDILATDDHVVALNVMSAVRDGSASA